MRSLRKTILGWTTLTLVAAGVAAASVSYCLASKEADDFLDGQLRQIALNIIDLPSEAVQASHTQREPEDDFLIEVQRNGQIIRSPADSIELPVPKEAGYSVMSAGGVEWRAFTSHTGQRSVVVAQQLSVRRELAERAAIYVAAPIAIVIPIAWIIISLAMSRAFDRLSEIGRSIQARAPDRLDPIPLAGAPPEVQPLIEGMNELFARLAKALDQQRQFVSDAAHHLRTPLSALYIQLENLRNAFDVDSAERDFGEMSRGLQRATKLVDQLLRLARFDGSQNPLEFHAVELNEIVASCIADQVPIAASKGIDLGIAELAPGRIQGSADELSVLFNTILENAIRYTPAGGVVDVSVRRAGDGFNVEIRDTGPGVDQEDLPRLTERFFRGSNSTSEGTGLGLAIVAAIVKRHGFDLAISNLSEGGLRVTIHCPRSVGSAAIFPGERRRPVAKGGA